MPPVNWTTFEQLPGAVEDNFEKLCRALMLRHYGQYGRFAARAAQPGVEFHLQLHTHCDLGEPGRWYGWQCRWYKLPSGSAIGTTRRQKIEKAIETTWAELPDLTDWVLWTRHPLTEGDQEWFYSLATDMRLHLWTSAEVEDYLSGNAIIFRGTYFGELILTPDILTRMHEQAVAPIRQRWQPDVHQIVDAERILRRMLGETDTWEDLWTLADQLHAGTSDVEADINGVVNSRTESVIALVDFANTIASVLTDVATALDHGDLDLLGQQLATRPTLPDSRLLVLPRQLRAARQFAAISVANLIADIHSARDLLNTIDGYLGMCLVAVCADAGCGKTQLAAQLTAATPDRPAGILLHGRGLHAGQSLDDLARGVVIQGTPVSSMEALVAAVDAAGQRAHRRIPIVIDGLNEAEDPRDWKGALASLREMLHIYPYTLVVCTLRAAFAEEALPQDTIVLEIPGFAHDTAAAVRQYFDYYQIERADAELPWDLLSHPLTLRIFCEVTNPTRERLVGIEAMPESLTALFDKYLEQTAKRIAELAPRNQRYYPQDVSSALDEIGALLWDERARSLDLKALRRRLRDDGRSWSESIVYALELDGILLRVPGESSGGGRVAPVYDALAGHLVADAILTRYGRLGFEQWIREPTTVTGLMIHHQERHPLATDVLDSLVGLVPRRLHRQQLWPLLEEPLHAQALRGAANLESAYIDAETVRALAVQVINPVPGQRDLFDRLRQTRGSMSHPLNVEFLDNVLRPMPVADRDLRWTEWIRRSEGDIRADLQRLEQRWRKTMRRTSDDRLRAQWIMWTLTSTIRSLRDQATRTLYWFGRGDPVALFSLTLGSLDINDSYVPERLLAASYGVVMAHQIDEPIFADALAGYLRGLCDALTGSTASAPTNHWLARHYVQMTVRLASIYYRDVVPAEFKANERLSFTPAPLIEPIPSDDPRAEEVDQTLHFDFRKDTLGHLFPEHSNYDMHHQGYQAAVEYIRGSVWNTGWRETGLGRVDRQLESYRSHRDRTIIDHYGQKYGWIGFYTYAGILADKGLPPGDERLPDLHIDPSFPEPPASAPIDLPAWSRSDPVDTRDWICNGVIPIPDDLLYHSRDDAHPGAWIAVQANLTCSDQVLDRRVFGILSALLVAETDANRLINALQSEVHPGNWWWLSNLPSDYYRFAGEYWWSAAFLVEDEARDLAESYRTFIHVDDGEPIEVELLTHRYDWESYHSELNTAGGAIVPSYFFSTKFDLRGIPQSFNQAQPDGTIASLSFRAPAGYSGNLLYLREDLVHSYAAGRRLIWFIWGERQFDRFPGRTTGWLNQVQRNGLDVWRYVRRGEELSTVFTSRPARRTRRSK